MNDYTPDRDRLKSAYVESRRHQTSYQFPLAQHVAEFERGLDAIFGEISRGEFEEIVWDKALLEAKREALTEARKVISQYLTTAEKWRYDRVMWAFAIMLGEIPEDTPEPLSPADEEEIARREAKDARG